MNFFAKCRSTLDNAYGLDKNAISADLLNDLVEIILRCINMIKNKKIDTYECVGPEIFTLYEIIKFSGIYSGRKAMVIPLPKFSRTNSSVYLEKMPGPTLMSRDNIASMSVPSIASKNKNWFSNSNNPRVFTKLPLNFFKE